MKTLHVAYRVTDLNRSLAYYSDLGYIEAGHVGVGDGTRLVFLKFPDEPVVTLELVHRRVDVGNSFDHLVIQTDALADAREILTEAGLEPVPPQYPAGAEGPITLWLTDPDGYPIELVEWPPGHADGITAADFT